MDREAVLDLIANTLEVERTLIALNTKRDSVPKWDSLAHIRIIAELEERLGAEIPIEEMGDIHQVDDFFRYISHT